MVNACALPSVPLIHALLAEKSMILRYERKNSSRSRAAAGIGKVQGWFSLMVASQSPGVTVVPYGHDLLGQPGSRRGGGLSFIFGVKIPDELRQAINRDN
jgi:hypothetical protein